jgi:hypothetical protein
MTNPLANLPLAVIQYPVGTFGFVGRVPSELAYICNDPELLQIALQHGSGLARGIAKKEGKIFQTRTWATRDEAIEAATAAGYKVA